MTLGCIIQVAGNGRASLRRCCLKIDLNELRANITIQENSILGGRNGKSKGPEEGIYFMCLKNSKKVTLCWTLRPS